MDDRDTWPSIVFVSAGAALSGFGVLLGAVGTHVFGQVMTAIEVDTFKTGVQYHLIHSIALVLVGLLMRQLERPKAAALAGWLFLCGIPFFSFSLYGIALLDAKFLGALAPIGGASFIAGWGCLVFAANKGWRQSP